MASLQKKGDAWYCQFLYGANGSKKRFTVTIGEVSDTEALQWKSRTENLLMRLRQGLLEVPRGTSLLFPTVTSRRTRSTRPAFTSTTWRKLTARASSSPG